MPQDGSEKTKNVFQSAKKFKIPNWIIWVVLAVMVLIAGGAVWYYSFQPLLTEQTQKDYYQELAEECKKNQDKACCLASVENMRSGGYKQMSLEGCPEGYQGNTLLCVSSYQWCELKTENQKIIGKIVFSDIEGGCWGFQSDNGKYFLIGGDKSEKIKKIPDVLSKKIEIQGKIEKDIVSYCPVGEGLLKLESYMVVGDSAINTSGWKIYRDEINGFEFQYPKNWIVEIIGNKTLKNSLLIGPSGVDDRTFIMQALGLDISDSSKYSSLKNFAEQQAGKEDGYIEKITLENTLINNVSAIKIHSADKSNYTRIVFFYEGKAFLLYDSGNLENESDKFKNILSTFKFIKSTNSEASTNSCNADDDCVLWICSGTAVNKEWAKSAPPDLPCATYYGYRAICVQNKCIRVR